MALLGRSSFRSHRIAETLIMEHRRTAYNDWRLRAIRTKSRLQCASESGEVLEIRNRLSFEDHAPVNHEHSVSLDRLHRVLRLV